MATEHIGSIIPSRLKVTYYYCYYYYYNYNYNKNNNYYYIINPELSYGSRQE